ncbi:MULTISPECIES: hypothetical protein [unclassified Streptomyces]|nr:MULTISPECIES: hypothetical protein [unclassified Streptomyces]SCK62396.1 hypothetical protein YW7DRAFT_06617 [Streptomyces sp. AmelKG-E11A]
MTRMGAHPEIAAMLRTVIQEWDEQHSGGEDGYRMRRTEVFDR